MSAREEILGRVRSALGGGAGAAAGVPASARTRMRQSGDQEAELSLLLREIEALGGQTRRFDLPEALAVALAGLVAAERVKRVHLWRSPELNALGLVALLAELGVEIAGEDASLAEIASCELGITGVDAALPETGTLLLRSGPGRPRTASLVPPIHLAIMTPAALRANLQDALADCPAAACVTLITGPSRTSDIELTLTIGVHGPRILHAWVLDAARDQQEQHLGDE